MKTHFTVMAIGLLALSIEVQAQTPCSSEPGQELTNCGFESGDPPTDWSLEDGNSFASTASARTGSAAGIVDGTSSSARILHTCLVPTVVDNYGLGASFQLDSASVSAVQCQVAVVTYSDTGCASLASSGPVASGIVDETSWTTFSGFEDLASNGVQSLELILGCLSANPFVVKFDDAFAGPDIFPVELESFSID